MDIAKLTAFIKLIENKTLVEVAKDVGMSISGVQRQISALEKELGLKLFQKEHKLLKPTEEGLRFYPHSLKIIEDYQNAMMDMSLRLGDLKGEFTINAFPTVISAWLIDDLAKFILAHPSMIVNIYGDDRKVDEIQRSWDVSIRADEEVSDVYEKKYIRTFNFNLYASQEYVRKNGLPRDPEDLKDHRLIIYGMPDQKLNPNLNWHLDFVPNGYQDVVYINSGHGIVVAIDNSLGIGVVSELGATLGKGEFVRILPQLMPKRIEFYLIYPRDSDKLDFIRQLHEYLVRKYANL